MPTKLGDNVGMDGTDRTSLIAHLEQHPDRLPIYAGALEAAIANLMEETYRATDPTEKAKLAMLEMRARLVMELWKSGVGVN